MSNILVYKKSIFNISETFIYKQVVALTEDNTVFVAGYKINNNFPIHKFSTIRLRKKLFPEEYRYINKLLSFLLQKKKSYITFVQLYKIIKQKKIELIHAHYGTGALEVLKVAKYTKTPLAVSFHGFDASSKIKNSGYAKQLPALFHYASAVIISSTHMIKTLKLQSWKKKVHFVPYGIDADFFKPAYKQSNGIVHLLHSGRVVKKKGVPDLIKVFFLLLQRHTNICLHIVGDGDELEVCKVLATQLNIDADKLLFYGAQTQQGVKNLMSNADIFILNSRTAPDGNMEGLPNAILEAMSMEKAVLSTYHAGIPDAITNGHNGLLVNEYDNADLQAALETLINNSDERMQLGKEARQTVLDNFTEQKMQQVLQELFSTLTA